MTTFRVGQRCSVSINDKLWSAFFVKEAGDFNLVYVRKMDRIQKVISVLEPNHELETKLKEKCKPVMYGLLESPAYFRFGTILAIKLGNRAYEIDCGSILDIDENEMVDKITCLGK